ncbi:MAG: thioesterase family protein [Pseudomonadota bacterium]
MAALFSSSTQWVRPEWIDYNGHLNMGYYSVLFDLAADEAYQTLGFGPDYLAQTGHTTYTAEFHIRYLREVKQSDRLQVSFRVIDFDAKRFHTFQEMYHTDGWLAATGEGLALHVDTSGPNVAPMPTEIQSKLARIKEQSGPHPQGVGRAVSMRRP